MDLIVAPGKRAALAAQKASGFISVVTVVVGDPVGSRLIVSLDRPCGNVTGMSSSAFDVTAKELKLLNEIVSHSARGNTLNATSKLHAALLKEFGDGSNDPAGPPSIFQRQSFHAIEIPC